MNILVILAHPSRNSFNHTLMKQYLLGAKQNNKLKTILLGDLKFDSILHEGYRRIQQLEPDLLKSQKLIRWADKIIIFTPVWWTTAPSILKAFFERTFHPSFAFKYTNSWNWIKLLRGKSARIIATMDSPLLYYKFITGDPLYKQIKGTLSFCGIHPIQKNYICKLKFKTQSQKKKILQQIYKIGLKEK